MVKPAEAMASARTLVLGDLHLTRNTPDRVTVDLARLLGAHGGARVIVAGDLFDLSADSPTTPSERAVREALGAHRPAAEALGRHLETGGELWLVGGNHDADLALDGFRSAIADALALSAEARPRLRATPWFFRDGAVHVEHGHLYDPDNAPAHPLVLGENSLGVHFVEEFIATTGAHAYLNANDQTPLKLFLSSFRWYGPRAPHVIYRYFHAAIAAMLKSGPLYRAHDEFALGQARAARFAEVAGVPEEVVEAVLALRARPTLESMSRTFTRLYFDRVLATISLGGGLGALAAGKPRAGAAALAFGAAVMGTSWAAGHDRYQGTVAERLAESGARIAETTGAKLVVFGHTHREGQSGAYANTGSFAFPGGSPGRPFLEIEGGSEEPRVVRRYLAA